MVAYQGAAASKRIFEIIDRPIKIRNETYLPNLKIENCNIEFKDISFKYESTKERALNNINLSIQGKKLLHWLAKVEPAKALL